MGDALGSLRVGSLSSACAWEEPRPCSVSCYAHSPSLLYPTDAPHLAQRRRPARVEQPQARPRPQSHGHLLLVTTRHESRAHLLVGASTLFLTSPDIADIGLVDRPFRLLLSLRESRVCILAVYRLEIAFTHTYYTNREGGNKRLKESLKAQALAAEYTAASQSSQGTRAFISLNGKD